MLKSTSELYTNPSVALASAVRSTLSPESPRTVPAPPAITIRAANAMNERMQSAPAGVQYPTASTASNVRMVTDANTGGASIPFVHNVAASSLVPAPSAPVSAFSGTPPVVFGNPNALNGSGFATQTTPISRTVHSMGPVQHQSPSNPTYQNNLTPADQLRRKIVEQQHQFRQRMNQALLNAMPLHPTSHLQGGQPSQPPSHQHLYQQGSSSRIQHTTPVGSSQQGMINVSPMNRGNADGIPNAIPAEDLITPLPGHLGNPPVNQNLTPTRNFNVQKQSVLQELYASIGKNPASANAQISNSNPVQQSEIPIISSATSTPHQALHQSPSHALQSPRPNSSNKISTTPAPAPPRELEPPVTAPSSAPNPPTPVSTASVSSAHTSMQAPSASSNTHAPAMPAPPESATPHINSNTDGMEGSRRCEITQAVRDVAERMQQSLYRGSNIYFTKAVFRVPTSVEEAFGIMKTGTFDVDKETDPANSLYFVSWAHTQYFAAQMAALGFRFKTCNLKRRVGQFALPPVDQWLWLERSETVRTAVAAPDYALPTSSAVGNTPASSQNAGQSLNVPRGHPNVAVRSASTPNLDSTPTHDGPSPMEGVVHATGERPVVQPQPQGRRTSLSRTQEPEVIDLT